MEQVTEKSNDSDKLHRRLYGKFYPSSKTNCPNINSANESAVRCVKCQELSYCSILNSHSLMEVYYPESKDFAETCDVVEQLGKRMDNTLFGPDKTFRDSPDCRAAVLQYLCLFWGSDNYMYSNCCLFAESDNGARENGQEPVRAPRPPCRSFCAHVARLCVNGDSARAFLSACARLPCSARAGLDECVRGPEIGGRLLDPPLNCSIDAIDSARNKYTSSAHAASAPQLSLTLLLLVVVFIKSCL